MAQVFVQLGLSHESPHDDSGYREGFRDYLATHAQPDDNIVLADPSPAAVEQLTRMWAQHPRARVTWAQVDAAGGEPRAFWAQPVGSPAPTVFTQDHELALRCCPQGGLVPTEVPCLTLRELLGAQDDIALLVWDPTATEAGLDLMSLPNLPRTMCVQGPVPAEVHAQLRALGYSAAGRAWGEAGSNRMYIHANSAADRGRAIAAQARVTAGEVVVRARTVLPTPDERRALVLRTRTALDRQTESAHVLDPSHGLQLDPVTRTEVLDAVECVRQHPDQRWSVQVDPNDEPANLATQCHDRHGLWPISFSFPDAWSDRTLEPDRLLSPITPGYPYSFTDPDQYLRSYGSAQWGITHRKAGWDCFRHVEILASGAVPLMIDAAEIPRYSMVHYPKQALATAAALAHDIGGAPDPQTRASFQSFFDRHLTCEAMARYMLEASGLGDAERILFVDEQHPHTSDYQSTLALVGLKRLRGEGVVPMFPAPWLYSDFSDEVGHLYGRGFGYSRSLDPSLRSSAERTPAPDTNPDLTAFDAVVIGSISRNVARARELLSLFPAARTIWIHGEDSPPTARQVHDLRASGTQVFVRSIESRTQGDARSLRRRARG